MTLLRPVLGQTFKHVSRLSSSYIPGEFSSSRWKDTPCVAETEGGLQTEGRACDDEEKKGEGREDRADDVLAFCVPFGISCFEFSALKANTGEASGPSPPPPAAPFSYA